MLSYECLTKSKNAVFLNTSMKPDNDIEADALLGLPYELTEGEYE